MDLGRDNALWRQCWRDRHPVSHQLSVNPLPAVCKLFRLTIEDAREGETTDQSRAVADEIDALYSNDFDFALAHVESVFEADPELPDQPPERTEHKRYRLSPKPRPC